MAHYCQHLRVGCSDLGGRRERGGLGILGIRGQSLQRGGGQWGGHRVRKVWMDGWMDGYPSRQRRGVFHPQRGVLGSHSHRSWAEKKTTHAAEDKM